MGSRLDNDLDYDSTEDLDNIVYDSILDLDNAVYDSAHDLPYDSAEDIDYKLVYDAVILFMIPWKI